MRDFFIGILGKLINIFVVIGILGVLLGAVSAATVPAGMGGPAGGGLLGALIILIGGLLYIAFMAGFMYLGLGIYHNTLRTAAATEKLAGRSSI